MIGGSIGLALRARRIAGSVVGVGRDETRLAEAQRVGAVDAYTTHLEDGVKDADVTVVCTPVTRIATDAVQAAEHGPATVLVTDAGSTKARIVAAVESHERGRQAYVGAHPIAGSERKGVAFAQADLFEGRPCVLTPTPRTPPDRLDRAHRFWSSLGCRIVTQDPDSHDRALAWTSHLPHAVAAALAATVPTELLALAAGAYRDGTRVAGSDAALWTGIFQENRQATLQALEAFERQLSSFRSALQAGDEQRLQEWWNAARARRQRYDETETPTGSSLPSPWS